MDGTHTPPPAPATPSAPTQGEPTHAGDTVAATPAPAVPAVNILPSTPPQPQDAHPQPSLHSSVAPTSVPLPQSTSSLASTTSAPYPPHPDQGPSTTRPAEPPFPTAAPAMPAPHTPVFASSPATYTMQPMVPPIDAAHPSHVFTPAPIPEVLGSRRSSLHLPAPPLPPKPTPLAGTGPPRRSTRSPSPRVSYEADAGPSRPLSVQTHSARDERAPAAFAMAGPYPLPATPALSSVPEPHVPRPARALSYAEGTPRRERPDAQRRASHGASLSRFDRDYAVAQRPTSGHSVNGSGVFVPPPEPIFGPRPTQSRRTSRRSSRPGGIEEDGDNPDESFSDTTNGELNARERLQPTLKNAEDKLKEARLVARATGWSLNFAIGAQARGSGEPEASTARAKDLENFVREARAWALDHGHRVASGEPDGGAALNRAVDAFRARFEEVMGAEQKGFGRMLHAERDALLGREREREKMPV
ncbi:hypothetical protein PsYK624_097490 [Phanerochaete sordida]|uniref:SMODS and SLOG-associating 2TM effector domain-containing protein n=1 Tax=Phanerochaete sordida TaxID=48140 RepID=A0A9P3GHA0_9APHY|nr:hypothetical protein PsYK624_097490 [Phanerochaete sordida]